MDDIQFLHRSFEEPLSTPPRKVLLDKLEKGNILPLSPNDFFQNMIGCSEKMNTVFENIRKIADSSKAVLLTGPPGSGKKLAAQAIHNLSNRKDHRALSVHCGTISSELLESDLFGHTKGPFTGALSDRKGRLELAHKGTLFIDDIGAMPFPLQIKLLRVFQEKKVEPAGCTQGIPIDVRIIATTHRDLENSVAQGHFRKDLFDYINARPRPSPFPLSRQEKKISLF